MIIRKMIVKCRFINYEIVYFANEKKNDIALKQLINTFTTIQLKI